MKALLVGLFLFCNLNAFAKIAERSDLATLQSIDAFDFPQNYVEVSEEGLPTEIYQQLLLQVSVFQFTLLEESNVQVLFEELEKNPKARMKNPKGACAQRRAYIQKMLKETNIVSGQLFINCPKRDGVLRLKDQVSGYAYTYSNYHDANIVAVKTNSGIEFRVLDLQFEDTPLSLADYLTEVELAQKIRPLKTRGTESNRGICYWSISTEFLTF
jgi:hypothetical protein